MENTIKKERGVVIPVKAEGRESEVEGEETCISIESRPQATTKQVGIQSPVKQIHNLTGAFYVGSETSLMTPLISIANVRVDAAHVARTSMSCQKHAECGKLTATSASLPPHPQRPRGARHRPDNPDKKTSFAASAAGAMFLCRPKREFDSGDSPRSPHSCLDSIKPRWQTWRPGRTGEGRRRDEATVGLPAPSEKIGL